MIFDPRGRSDKKEFGKVYSCMWAVNIITTKLISSVPVNIALAVISAVLGIFISMRRLRDAGKSVVPAVVVPLLVLGIECVSLLQLLNFDAENTDIAGLIVPLAMEGIVLVIAVVYMILLSTLKSVPIEDTATRIEDGISPKQKKVRKNILKPVFAAVKEFFKRQWKKVVVGVCACIGSILIVGGTVLIVRNYLDNKIDMIAMPGKDYKILKTEVTVKLYEKTIGENPSYVSSAEFPVSMVSWYDAIYFCNKLSKMRGLKPVYSVDGETDVAEWGYIPHSGKSIRGSISKNNSADGFRLPTVQEWVYAAKGGEDYKYSGSDDINEVGWNINNSGSVRSVARKKSNGYGLYDMTGNVYEWVWYSNGESMGLIGGCYMDEVKSLEEMKGLPPELATAFVGFRIVCSSYK